MGKLLRLELFNFKSYKGHHIVLFGDAYFTSIIGPNGSGKSNSMDAISFVLGIRSSHLRSSHLRDLTYRGRVLKTSKINDDGSAEIPPQAPAAKDDDILSDGESGSLSSARNIPKSAWVMAVYLDDAEDEQKWKRTITIQGASEYRINDRVVTAGQYNAALESENILINARNFLVFQGDVEKIASQSPKELTRLIEQISGSLEYKAEYERLEDEAKQTADNQQHRLEIRRSINSELKQFREQKKEADAYLAKANELDQATVTYNLWELYHLKLEIDEVVRSIKDHQENLKEYRRGVEKYEKTLEDARQAQSKVAKDVSRVERTIKQKEKEIGNKENSVVPIDQKIEITADAIRKSSNKIDSLAREQENHNNEIRKLEKDLAIIEKAGQDFERKRQETLSKQGKKLSETDYKEYNTLKAQVVAKTGENQVTLNHLIRQLKNDQITVDSLQRKVRFLQTSVDRLQIEINDLSDRKEAILASVTQITQDIDSKKKELTHVISERIRLNQKHTELEEKLRRVLNEISDADDGRRRNQKEQSMKDTIAALKRIYRGVRGRVGDLCKPKQKKYDEAIITALGRDFDSVVVDTEKTAIECVQYLKDRRSSPMTFVPLDKIKVSGPDANLKGLPKARLTIDTIEFDSSLERAMAYACGDSIVCDDLDTAKHICFERHIKVKAVTLQGEVIHKAGLMTGGRGPDQGNKRKFDDQDVEKLRAQVTRFQNEIETLPERHRRGAAEEILQNDLLRLERKLSDANSELTTFDQNLTSKKKELAYEQRQLQELQPGLIEKENALHQIQDNVAKLQKIVDGAQDDIFVDFCNRLGYSDIRAYEAQQGSLEQQYDEERSKYKKQKAKLTAQIKWDTEQRDDITNRIRSMERTVESLKVEIMEYENERAALEEAIDSDNAKVTELNDELRRHKEKLAQRIEKVNQARNELHKQSKNLEEHSKEIAALEIQAQQLASKRYAVLSRCKMEQIAIPLRPNSRKLESLPLEKEITLQPDPDEMEIDEEDNHPEDLIKDDGINVNTDSLDQDFLTPGNDVVGEGLKQRIIDLKVELEKLNPNMRATDRLKGTEDRLKIIEKDFEDARKAATRAKDAFDDVKSIRNDLFHKAFGHISEGIQNVYKELTRSSAFPLGGSAYLDIEDSDEPYLSGIKYHAMPPLKRFRDMEHLSGGEKTMAALALLFAVHSFKPSPFFVLDEVDAALDNSNVESIKNYIQGHAGPGMQFIVISLKTGLFQGSESLVGVFRDQEANSSKTLTIDLRKYRAA